MEENAAREQSLSEEVNIVREELSEEESEVEIFARLVLLLPMLPGACLFLAGVVG